MRFFDGTYIRIVQSPKHSEIQVPLGETNRNEAPTSDSISIRPFLLQFEYPHDYPIAAMRKSHQGEQMMVLDER